MISGMGSDTPSGTGEFFWEGTFSFVARIFKKHVNNSKTFVVFAVVILNVSMAVRSFVEFPLCILGFLMSIGKNTGNHNKSNEN